jgi:endonuclease YncB( thermonuclease family)
MIVDDNHCRRVLLIRDIDGDTVRVMVDQGLSDYTKEDIRLDGIDAPDRNKPAERQKANLATNAWLTAARVLVVQTVLIPKTQADKREKYGRYLGTFWRDDDPVSLNQYLMDHGFAVWYDGGKRA